MNAMTAPRACDSADRTTNQPTNQSMHYFGTGTADNSTSTSPENIQYQQEEEIVSIRMHGRGTLCDGWSAASSPRKAPKIPSK